MSMNIKRGILILREVLKFLINYQSMKSGIANKVIYKRIFFTKTSVPLCLIMTEMRDAVAFMCIFLHFKRVDPATTIAGVQSQPFSFTVAHAIRNE